MTDSKGTEKEHGVGADSTIPDSSDGIAVGIGDEKSNFNHEEDPESASGSDSAHEQDASAD